MFTENAELWFLAEKGDIEAIRVMLRDERQNIQYDRQFCYKIAKGETALHIAAKRGHKELAQLLIKKGWDPECRNYRMESPGRLASNFLKSVRNGIKERVKSEEVRMQMLLSQRYTSMFDKAVTAFKWIDAFEDGRLGVSSLS